MYGTKGLHKWSLLCHSTNVMCISEIHTSSVYIYFFYFFIHVTGHHELEDHIHWPQQRWPGINDYREDSQTLYIYIYIHIFLPRLSQWLVFFLYIYIYLDSPCIYIYIHKYVAGLKHFFTLEATPASSDQEVACIYKDARIPKIKRSTVLTIVKICNLYCTAAVCSDPAFAWQRIDCYCI